jgi:hypothetical protein
MKSDFRNPRNSGEKLKMLWNVLPTGIFWVAVMSVPIVSILVKHQQRMAEIIHSRSGNQAEVDELRLEVRDLRARLDNQALAIDSLGGQQRRADPERIPVAPLS